MAIQTVAGLPAPIKDDGSVYMLGSSNNPLIQTPDSYMADLGI
jgi:hypothetical protein